MARLTVDWRLPPGVRFVSLAAQPPPTGGWIVCLGREAAPPSLLAEHYEIQQAETPDLAFDRALRALEAWQRRPAEAPSVLPSAEDLF